MFQHSITTLRLTAGTPGGLWATAVSSGVGMTSATGRVAWNVSLATRAGAHTRAGLCRRRSSALRLSVHHLPEVLPGVCLQGVPPFSFADAAIGQKVASTGRLGREHLAKTLFDHGTQWSSGPLRVPLCARQQFVLDVERYLHAATLGIWSLMVKPNHQVGALPLRSVALRASGGSGRASGYRLSPVRRGGVAVGGWALLR